MDSFKNQAEVLMLCDHYKFRYYWQLLMFIRKFRPDLLSVFTPEFSDRVKSRLFRLRNLS